MRLSLLSLTLGVLGCGLEAPRAGTVLSLEGPPVARARFESRVRHDALLTTTVIFPSNPEGRPVGEGLPAVVFVQGGKVATTDYEWLARGLAQRGYVVALPEHSLELAIFEIDNGHFAADLLRDPPEGSALDGLVDSARIGVSGHSLGGVVATKNALGGGFAALALEASFPDSGDDDALPGLGMPSLSLGGRLDCSAKLEDVRAGFEKLPSPSALVVLDGVTHYQFTASEQPDLDRGCTPGIDLETAHARILEANAAFFDAALSGEGVGADGLATIPGAEVTIR